VRKELNKIFVKIRQRGHGKDSIHMQRIIESLLISKK